MLLKAIALDAVTSLYVSQAKAISQVQLLTANCSLKVFSFCLSWLELIFIRERSLNACPSVERVAEVFCAAKTAPTFVLFVFAKNLYPD